MKSNKVRKDVSSNSIDLKEDYEVQYWASRFRISQKQLREAIRNLGTSYINDVEKYFEGLIKGSHREFR